MRNLLRFIALTTLLLSAPSSLFAQRYGNFGSDTSAYRMGLYKSSAMGSPLSQGGASGNLTGTIKVGSYNSGVLVTQRAFYQWNFPDTLVPAGSTIDTVQIHIEYTYSPPFDLVFAANFYNCSYWDLSNNPDLSALWNLSQGSSIASETSNTGVLDRTYSSGSGPAVINAVQQYLQYHRFVLGIAYQYEGSYDSVYTLKNSTVKLRIVFTYPTKPVVVDQQIVSTTTSIDSVAHWETNTFATYKAPHTFSFYQTDTVTLRATQKLLSNTYKYKNWSTDNNVVNPKQFTIFSGTTSLIASVDTVRNATIQSQLIDGGNPGGSLNFQDPWLLDSTDPLHGNSPINRGMSAGFNSVAYASNNLGTSTNYKGVFLNQPIVSGKPYYSVSAPLTQTNINGYAGYFQNWSGTNVTFQNSGVQQTAVVFTNSGATITANYKGHLVSSVNTASGYSNQRRLFVDPAGYYNLVYESKGEIWFTKSYDGGKTWSQEIMLSAGRGTAHNPSITQWTNAAPAPNFVYVLWTDVSSNGNGYSIYARRYLCMHVDIFGGMTHGRLYIL